MNKFVAVASFVLLLFANNPCQCQQWKVYADSSRLSLKNGAADKAFLYYTKAKKLNPPTTTFADSMSGVLVDLAQVYYRNKNNKGAIAICEEIRTITSAAYGEMNKSYAFACNMLAAIAINDQNLDLAKTMAFKAKEIREKLFGDKDLSYAQSCNTLGVLYYEYGEFSEAEPLLVKAVEIRKGENNKSPFAGYAISSTALGNLYREIGQYDKAEQLYREAMQVRQLLKDTDSYVASCNILADLYSTTYMGKPGKAETLYLEAKEIMAKKDKESPRYAETCNNLASLYRDLGRYNEAEPLALEAKKIFTDNEDEVNITKNLNGLGELYYAMGQYKKAEQFFLKARAQWKKILDKDHPYLIDNTEALAKLYGDMNQGDRAASLYKEVIESKYNQLNKVFAFTNENEKQLYVENVNGSNDEYYSFYYDKVSRSKAGQSYSLSLLYRNLILSSSRQLRQVIYHSSDTSLRKDYANWITLKEQLSRLYGQGAEANSAITNSLENQADSIEKLLSRRSSAFATVQKRVGWQDIQKKLKPTEAAIEFAEFQYENGKRNTDSIYYIALLLRKDKPEPELITLFEKKQLDSLFIRSGNKENNDNVTAFYTRGIDNKENQSSLNNHSAYRLIWMPIEKKLKGITKIYFAPAGLLHRVSFAALSPDSSRTLSDKYQLVQLSSTASVADLKNEYLSPADKIDLYGDIAYGTNSASSSTGKNYAVALPGTAKEISSIKNLRSQNTFLITAMEATGESVKKLDGNASPAVLHIATHGFFNPDPQIEKEDPDDPNKRMTRNGTDDPLLRSGLLMAGVNNAQHDGTDNGILTSYDLSNLYLPNTKLVVLSACETGLGDIEGNEGVYGLQRAFKMAGVQHLVMSLWKVPDDETAEFMQCFYENLFSKESIQDAFTHAQTVLKNKYRKQPLKWGAWILVR